MEESGTDTQAHPVRERIENLEFDGDAETARRLAEEGRRTVDHQLNALDDVDSKAVAILKLDLVIAGTVLTVASFTSDATAVTLGALNNRYTAVATTALVLSAALAASTYTASDSEVGIGSEAIRDAVDADLTAEEFEIAAAQSYAAWIEFNDRTNVLTVPLITLTVLLVVIAVVHLALGVYAAFVGVFTNVLATGAWAFLLVVAVFAGLPTQLSRAADEVAWRDLKPDSDPNT